MGNEDLHLKNLSIVTIDEKVQLSPVYDFVNSTIINSNSDEELALSIGGKKKDFTKIDFTEGFAMQTLFLRKGMVEKELQKLLNCIPEWKIMIEKSFLSASLKIKYIELINKRAARLR